MPTPDDADPSAATTAPTGPRDMNSRVVAVGDTVALTGRVREVCDRSKDGCGADGCDALEVEVGHGAGVVVTVPAAAVVVASHGSVCPACSTPTTATPAPVAGDTSFTMPT